MTAPDSGKKNRDMLTAIARMQARGEKKQNRLSWLDGELKVSEMGPVVYFVGCVPFADLIFGRQVEHSIIEIPRASVRLLNSVGVKPVVLADEVCCGLDAFIGMDVDTVNGLAEKNIGLFEAVGARTIVATCSAGVMMLKKYSELGFDHGCEVLHLVDFLAGKMPKFALPPKTGILTCTGHDAVDGGREHNVSRLSDLVSDYVDINRLVEEPMDCCGTEWLPRDAAARSRIDRLIEAADGAGCERILTLCPKCLISLKFATRPGTWVKSAIDVQDLILFIAKNLGKKV
ncbi:MAG: (Fe-S)-binding protein [Candidatus Coatesbacteria bacterium]|nr:(Fe-S)-binding protein [Candidatus Coatesbacteria bacterium]